MGKKYSKPGISFHPLALSADLSAGCTLLSNFAEFSCPVMIPEWGETVFTYNSGCDWSNDDVYVCYHVPTASSNIFSS